MSILRLVVVAGFPSRDRPLFRQGAISISLGDEMSEEMIRPKPCAFCWLSRSVVDVDLMHVCFREDGEVWFVVSFCSSKCESAFMLLTTGEGICERYADWWGE